MNAYEVIDLSGIADSGQDYECTSVNDRLSGGSAACLFCQSGRWKSTSHSGKRTFLYLENYSQIDIYCPLGWSEVSLTRIYSGNSLNYRRICSIESAVDVLYLEDSSSQVVPSCPVGFVEYCWTGIMNAGSMVYRRTCLSV